MARMNVVQHVLEQLLGYTVEWEATAAWAQAVGTILALVLAIELPRWTARRDMRVFRETVLAYCKVVRDGVWAVAVLDGTLKEAADEKAVMTISVEVNLPSHISALEQLPLVQLGNSAAVDRAIRLAGAARGFLSTSVRQDLSIEEATLILMNGRTARRHAVDQVMSRYDQLVAALR